MSASKQFEMQNASPESFGFPESDVERYMRTLIRGSPFFIFALSPSGIIKYADGAALKSLGMPAKQAMGRSVFDLYKHAPWILDAVRTVIQELHSVTASGKIPNGLTNFWYDARYIPAFDVNGNLTEIVGYSLDVTAEKRAKDLALQLAEEKSAAMEASMDGMASIGQDGNIHYANDSLLRIYGFSNRESLMDKNWRILFEETEILRLSQIIKETFAYQRHWRGEAVSRKFDGQFFFIELSLSQIVFGGQARGIVCVVRDITEHKTHLVRRSFVAQAAAALSESLDYELTLKRAANFAVRKFASWCVVTLVNEEGVIERVIVGADPDEEVVSALLSDIPFRCSEKYFNKRVHLTHQMDKVHRVDEEFLRNLFPDEKERTRFNALDISAYICVPLMISATFLGAITFIKSRKKLNPGESPYYDEHDAEAVSEVATRMALAVQNAKLYRETKDAVRSREDLIASVSHDLKNPLSAISLNAELIAKVSDSSPKSTVFKKLSGTIKASVDRMTSLIRELLELEKLRGGSLFLVKKRISCKSLIDTATSEIEALMSQKSISMIKHVPNQEVYITADHDRLLQVFSNLLGNALKYTPVGGQIDISCIDQCHEVQFSVHDNGSGIRKEDLPRIFDRYWRSEGSDKMGAGIGLTIVRSIITSHGGSIWAESDFNQGSTFSFTIPVELW